MTREELDILQQLVPFIQKAESSLMIASKERVTINDIETPKDFEKDLKHALNLIKALDKNVMTAIIKTRNNEKEHNYKYYEVVFKDYQNLTHSICIKGIRKPTDMEAHKFCKGYMEKMGYGYVYEVNEITKEEADMFFDTENEYNWPVFGKKVDK